MLSGRRDGAAEKPTACEALGFATPTKSWDELTELEQVAFAEEFYLALKQGYEASRAGQAATPDGQEGGGRGA